MVHSLVSSHETYKAAVKWLDSSQQFGMKLDLENIRFLLAALGNPHLDIPFIHVAGTNGKGSTCAMIASILKAAGYTFGLYTSPHLVSPRERIQTHEGKISEDAFASIIERLRSLVAGSAVRPTYFELTTAAALSYFGAMQVDLAVLETGMGGKFDATNIVDSKIQVITSISLEHTQYLGGTMSEIAKQKCGIIKPGSTVITSARGEALKEIRAFSSQEDCRLVELGKDIQIESGEHGFDGQRVVIYTSRDRYPGGLSLLGVHQIENAALAIATIETLGSLGYRIRKEDILQGLKAASWPCRFEVLKTNPPVILDAAHNPAACQVLVRGWKDYVCDKKARIVFSALQDKDVAGMARALGQIADQVYLVEVRHSRGMPIDALRGFWVEMLGSERVFNSDVQSSLELIHSAQPESTPFLITGSFYLLGEILERASSFIAAHP